MISATSNVLAAGLAKASAEMRIHAGDRFVIGLPGPHFRLGR